MKNTNYFSNYKKKFKKNELFFIIKKYNSKMSSLSISKYLKESRNNHKTKSNLNSHRILITPNMFDLIISKDNRKNTLKYKRNQPAKYSYLENMVNNMFTNSNDQIYIKKRNNGLNITEGNSKIKPANSYFSIDYDYNSITPTNSYSRRFEDKQRFVKRSLDKILNNRRDKSFKLLNMVNTISNEIKEKISVNNLFKNRPIINLKEQKIRNEFNNFKNIYKKYNLVSPHIRSLSDFDGNNEQKYKTLKHYYSKHFPKKISKNNFYNF